ncbi:hypothetical protein [Nonomuraea sp. NPDC050643]|uniref:hypothetical protein n=1 Tax=Nonomuraea sp. NPDC050643 TaxID=3155660 RepID=UPI00340606AA
MTGVVSSPGALEEVPKLSVQARSAIRMEVIVRQSSRCPGGDAQIRVSLAEAGIPLAHTASVHAEISGPAAKPYVMPLPETADGEFGGILKTPVAGLYRVHLQAKGISLRGEPFIREELRTVAVWTRIDDPGLGSALFTSVQQVGRAVGIAVLVTVSARHSDAQAGSPGAATEGFALTIAAVLVALGALLMAALLRARRVCPHPPDSSPSRLRVSGLAGGVDCSVGCYRGWGDVVIFAGSTAARIGEVSGVRVGDVDTQTWIWTVRRQTTPSPGGLGDKGTKGERARKVPLIAEVRELVLKRLQAAGPDPEARLFCGPRGGRIATAVLRDATHWDEVVAAPGTCIYGVMIFVIRG